MARTQYLPSRALSRKKATKQRRAGLEVTTAVTSRWEVKGPHPAWEGWGGLGRVAPQRENLALSPQG